MNSINIDNIKEIRRTLSGDVFVTYEDGTTTKYTGDEGLQLMLKLKEIDERR